MEDNAPAEAEVDNWYRDSDGNYFKVVAIESDGEAIEVQYFDGSITEFDPQAWRERRPRDAEPPEDWSGSVDMSDEDFRTSNDEITSEDAENPIDRLNGLE